MEEIIEIEEMEFLAYHGCYETEQIVGNKFTVYARISTTCGQAAISDDINDTINYLTVYEIIAREMAIPSHLLEHVAKRIVDAIYFSFPQIKSITIKISKLNPPLGGKVAATSVTLTK